MAGDNFLFNMLNHKKLLVFHIIKSAMNIFKKTNNRIKHGAHLLIESQSII